MFNFWRDTLLYVSFIVTSYLSSVPVCLILQSAVIRFTFPGVTPEQDSSNIVPPSFENMVSYNYVVEYDEYDISSYSEEGKWEGKWNTGTQRRY